jgi:hypothetical protein
MLLSIALALALLYSALKPIGDGLFDTSMWVAKMLAPTDTAEGESAKQFLKVGQAALMEGWLSNVPFIMSIAFFSSIILSFLYHWWAAAGMFFVAITLGVLTKLIWGGSALFYLSLLYHKMMNRAADYKRDKDVDRSSAAESYCGDLEEIMSIYRDARMRPPTAKQLKEIPYGDLYYWREHGVGGV